MRSQLPGRDDSGLPSSAALVVAYPSGGFGGASECNRVGPDMTFSCCFGCIIGIVCLCVCERSIRTRP